MKKRGLSNVVATILIVLVALAAVALISNFFLSGIRESGESFNLQARCANIEVAPVSCTINGEDNLTVIAKLNNGEPSKIIAEIEFDDETTTSTNQVDAPEILSTTELSLNIPEDKTPASAKVAGIVMDEGENAYVCPLSFDSVTCS